MNIGNPELEEHVQRIIELLGREDLGGVLINGQHNFAWLTGGASNGIDLSRENGIASILVRRDGKRYLLANNIEMPRLTAEQTSLGSGDLEPVEYSWQLERSSANFVTEKAGSLISGELVTDIPIAAGIRTIDGLLSPLRCSLTAEAIERYRSLGKDAGKALRATFEAIRPGETEIEIAAKMRAELAKYKIQSVVTLVAADERIDKFRHPVPAENRWKKTVLFATCGKRHGLIASLSRIGCIGRVSAELVEKTEAAAYVNAKLWAATRPGVTGSELYETAKTAYSDRGFPDEINNHHQGGAAGYRTREWVAHPACTETVKINQAFAWNPSITGTKVEETVIVTENSLETITASPDLPTIKTTVEGREFISPGILEI